ncbi:MAG: PRC-barrel domain-containing protein, partial [Verrucomicrobiae bacterium]|nr:PRC-barrel domain-containing protein [Verrucomicrobiae bacterium]
AENAQVLMGATSKMMHDPKRMALAMEVLNENVYASEGDRIGKADNWVINPADDTIAYIIVRNIRFGTPTGPDHDYYLIQANEVEKIDRHDSDIHVAVPSNALNEAPSVSQTDMVDTMQRNDTLVFRYEPAS